MGEGEGGNLICQEGIMSQRWLEVVRGEKWNKETRILWIFRGMKEGKRVREGEADDLPRGVTGRERTGHSDEHFHRPESSRLHRRTEDTRDLFFGVWE